MSNLPVHEIWNGSSGAAWVRHQRDLDLFLAGSMQRLAGLLPLAPGTRVLEVGSGAGSFSIALSEAVGPGGQVLGLDVSAPLMRLARERAAGRHNLGFARCDIQTDRLEAQGFDICTAHIGMMFYSDPVLALTRLRSRLVPGAMIAFNGWAAQDNPWFSLPIRVAERHLGPLPAGTSEGPPPPGPLAFADVTYVTALLRAAGYDAIEGWQEAIMIRHPGGLDALMQTLSYVGPISTLYRLKQPDAAARARIAAEIREEFSRHIDADGAVALPGSMTFYRAVAP